MLFERLDEIGRIEKAVSPGDLLDGGTAFFQGQAGLLHTPVPDIFGYAGSHFLAEDPVQISGRVARDLRQMIQRQFFIQMIVDVAQDPSQMLLRTGGLYAGRLRGQDGSFPLCADLRTFSADPGRAFRAPSATG